MSYLRKFLGTPIAAIGVAMVAIGPIAGATWGQCELEKLLPSDGETLDEFGSSVAIGPTMAIAGAHMDDGQRGAAYLFDGQQLWAETQKLTPTDPKHHDQFGFSVAISGDILVVGAPNDDDEGNGAGAVYVFRFDGSVWCLEQKLTAIDAEAFSSFGSAVDIDGDVIIIGETGDDDNGMTSGAAHIFRHDGFQWEEEQKLIASDGDIDDRFGISVAIDGDVALVGALHNDDACPKIPECNSGSAYVYEFDASRWTEVQKLVPDDTVQGARFGWSVSLDTDTAVIGASQDDNTNGEHAGAAYIFAKDLLKWEQQQKLLASDGEQDDLFGRSVAISGERIIIGVPFDDDNGNNAGAAFVFGETSPQPGTTSWTEQAKLLASDGQGNGSFGDSFGFAVSIEGDLAIVGALFHDDNGFDSGSAYMFDLEPTLGDLDCNGSVGVKDLLILLANWGPCGDCDDCPADLDGDCSVGVADLLILLANWG